MYGTVIGTLSTVDEDQHQSHTYRVLPFGNVSDDCKFALKYAWNISLQLDYQLHCTHTAQSYGDSSELYAHLLTFVAVFCNSLGLKASESSEDIVIKLWNGINVCAVVFGWPN